MQSMCGYFMFLWISLRWRGVLTDTFLYTTLEKFKQNLENLSFLQKY